MNKPRKRWEETSLNREGSLFDAEYTAACITELEQQLERGEIESRAYIIKKHALVRLFMKATTTPRRKPRSYED